MVVRSEDGGRSWGEPLRLPDGMLGPIKNKPVLLEDGRLLCPSSTEHDGWRMHVEWTADQGRTWEKTGPIGDGETMQIIQPTFLVHGAGRVQALCRSRQKFVAETWSEDGGRSWSEPRLTDLPNPNSGFDGVTLGDGRHLLVHNPSTHCRTPLVVATSEDGVRWEEVATLETGVGAFSYPAVIQSSDGIVHISYTNLRKTITHVAMDPSAFVVT
jgi:predicted neuraminidase